MMGKEKIRKRRQVLYELMQKFFDEKGFALAEDRLERGDHLTVESVILVKIDSLYENGVITEEQARNAYVTLNLKPALSSSIRQGYALSKFYYQQKTT